MNKDHVAGKFNNLKGKVKEEVGHATGDTSLEGKGIFEQVKGKVQEKFADLKDAVKEKVDHALEKKDRSNAA